MNVPTKEKFIEFVENLDALGVLSERTTGNIKIVVTALSDSIPNEQLATEWDLQEILNKFREGVDIKDETARTYLSRFKSAVDKFIAHTNGEELKPVVKRKPAQKKKIEEEVEVVKTFSLPIPLRENLIVNVDNLPRDLSEEEADRIATIIKSFAIRQ
ncbi:hypothetical protein [Proteus mirabilis]|uniref:hypothetical protein n=1 Tax=Proteus mirabilis TaxID=584 RepID=UPI0034D3BD4F